MNEVFQDGGVPIKSWAIGLEDGAKEQMTNVSRLPFIIGHAALMPDAHQGYGMPVGGVFMADRAVVPYAIGVDIGCGVMLIETDIDAEQLRHEDVVAFMHAVSRSVPVGNGPQAEHKKDTNPPRFLDGHLLEGPMADIVWGAGRQLGTLGGGNHFLELQRGEKSRVYFMIHSGSRSVGKKTCDRHQKIAQKMNARWHSALPHKEVAWLPIDAPEGKEYLRDMNIALAWAEENRLRMAEAVIADMKKVLGGTGRIKLDIHHNYASFEHHFGRDGVVHRKGAVRAAELDTVLIPGSMSTGSYIAEGLGNPDSLHTCQHGAGRARSRSATRKMFTLADMETMLFDAGVTLITPKRESVIDESAPAYKDIDDVMAASADLVRPIERLTPLGVVKG